MRIQDLAQVGLSFGIISALKIYMNTIGLIKLTTRTPMMYVMTSHLTNQYVIDSCLMCGSYRLCSRLASLIVFLSYNPNFSEMT